MPAAHGIEVMEVALALGPQAEAWARHGALGDFAAGRGIEVIGEVFDEFAGDEVLLRIDRLDVDLGETPADVAAFERQLRAGLRRALAAMVGGGSGEVAATPFPPARAWSPGFFDDAGAGADGARAAAAVIIPGAGDRELLWRLLRHGRLPWSAVTFGAQEIDALVEKVLAREGEAFAAALRADPHLPRIVARIAQQWLPAHRARLLALLSPDAPPPTPAASSQAWEQALVQATADGRPAAEPDSGHLRSATELPAPVNGAQSSRVAGPASGGVAARTRGEGVAAGASDHAAGNPSGPRAAGPSAANRVSEGFEPRERADPDDADVLPAWRIEAGHILDRAGWPAAHWESLAEQAPDWLTARVRALGRGAAWRAAFAANLGQAELALLLGLWLPAAAAVSLASAVGAASAWSLPAGMPAAAAQTMLREWLLSAVLTAPDEPPDPAALLWDVVRRGARRQDLSPVTVAARLLDHGRRGGAAAGAPPWPAEVVRWLEAEGRHDPGMLVHVPASEAPSPGEPGGEPALQAHGAAAPRPAATPQDADAAEPKGTIPSGPLTVAWLEGLPRPLPPHLVQTLGRALRPSMAGLARIERLPEAMRRDLLLRLAGEGALSALAVIDRTLGGSDPLVRDEAWSFLLSELFEPDAHAPPGPFEARWTARRQDIALALTRPGAATAGPDRPIARGGPASEHVLGSDDPTTGFAPPAGALSAAWLAALPRPLPPSAVQALTRALTPAAVGLARLQALSEAERRDLLLRLAGRDGAAALAAVEQLAATWAKAGFPEPAEGAADADWRFLLDELVEQGRLFESHGFTARWIAARLDAVFVRVGESSARALGARLAAGLRGAAPTAQDIAATADAPLTSNTAATADAPPTSHTAATADASPTSNTADTARSADAATTPSGQDIRVSGRVVHAPPAATARPDGHAPETGSREDWRRDVDRPDAGVGQGADLPIERLLAQALASSAVSGQAAPRGEARVPPATAEPDPGPDATDYVANAGLVLAGPFIPMLLGRLDLTRDGAFLNDAAAERAVLLLQLVVDAEEPPLEHQLVLNKVLCGWPLAKPVTRDFAPSPAERETIDSLLRAVIERWGVLGATSVAGLRESFLQRRGALTSDEEAWRLRVEARPFDMLIDQVPWGFRALKLPWMEKVLHVEWR